MNEILNQKVVDLYFERKRKLLEDTCKQEIETVKHIDPHQSFVAELKRQFDEYVEANKTELKSLAKNSMLEFNVSLPCTLEYSETKIKLYEQLQQNINKLDELKEEILAMLSGCAENPAREMEVLKAYGIIGEDGKMVSLQTN